MRFLLDTDICIYASKSASPGLIQKMERARPDDLGMSIVTYCELAFGAWNSRYPERNLANLERLKERIPVLALDEDTAGTYGRLRAELEADGTPIGPYDLLIAAHAISRNLTLVSNNMREFSRIKGLKLENWAA